MVRSGFNTADKGTVSNIVTTSDLNVQHFLCDRLHRLVPEAGFLCEEEDCLIPSKESMWIIDPIDGTANYSRGISDCAISVALRRGDRICEGVVFSPWRGEMYTASLGQGAFLNGERIHVSDRDFSHSILCTAMSIYRKELAYMCSDIIMDTFMECNDVRRFGSAAVELCLLASGRCELYFEMRLQPWDFAAGELVLSEAGGVLTGIDGGPFSYTGPAMTVGANSAENHARLLEIVHRHLTELPYSD